MVFEGSHLWKLRQVVGKQLLLVPGAQVVVVDERERVLFQRRVDSGAWELPGGAAEPGLSFRETAARQWMGELVPGADEVIEARFFEPGEVPAPLQPQQEAVWEMYAAYRATGLFQGR
ncbi:NUDIX domain-containing protein [Kribbella catacumbae]|uniref:NUDIX domain-containing protein n=1 Tax=Kribbella catacumbae TaxID=460086 RepID=UPI00037C646D|nr:NUDIX domain-containing protein [Kribbella catacumbae]